MDKGRYLVEAHLREGRSVAELARVHGVHPSWIYRLLARYRAEGDAGLIPRSRRPKHSPNAVASELEERDRAVAQTARPKKDSTPARTRSTGISHDDTGMRRRVSTIWRVLRRRGFVTPQPQKRPKSLVHAFRSRPPQRVLAVRHDALDPRRRHRRRDRQLHRRPQPALRRVRRAAGHQSHRRRRDLPRRRPTHWGTPASMLTDNGAIYTATLPRRESRHGNPHSRRSASPTSTPGPTTPRPAARSNASTRPSRSSSPNNPPPHPRRAPSPTRPVRRPTTTTSDHIARSADAHHDEAFNARIKAHPPAPIPDDALPRPPRHESTHTARSPSATKSKLHHIGMGARHAANPSSCSSPTATSASSPQTANSSATSPSTRPATTNPKPPGWISTMT